MDRRFRFLGLILCVTIGIVSMGGGEHHDSNGPEALRAAQMRSMADMRMIATAWEARATDTNSYSVDDVMDGEVSTAQMADALAPTYIRKFPRNDAWGTDFVCRVSEGGQGYSIRSFGANKRFDETPDGATTSPDADILFVNPTPSI